MGEHFIDVGTERPAVELVSAADVAPERIDWLWPGWLAAGKVHILAGSPGTGKTTIALSIGAAITTGGRWPDGARAPIGDVVMWSGEDGISDTLVPRLMAHGADLNRVRMVDAVTDLADGLKRPFDPAVDLAALSEAIASMETAPRLLVVDPVVSAVAGDSHKNAEVRRALQPLVDVARKYRLAVIGITHLTKGTAGRDPVERVTGSLAFGALARTVLAAAKLPDEQGGGRVLALAKSNLARDTGAFAYDVEGVDVGGGIVATCVAWGERMEGTARDILAMSENQNEDERGAMAEACDFLQQELAAGPVNAKQVYTAARECGISERTLKRAKAALGVAAEKAAFQGGWRWSLPKGATKGATQNTWPPSADLAPFVENPNTASEPKREETHEPKCQAEVDIRSKGANEPEGGQGSGCGPLHGPLGEEPTSDDHASTRFLAVHQWLDRIGETDSETRVEMLMKATLEESAMEAYLALAAEQGIEAPSEPKA